MAAGAGELPRVKENSPELAQDSSNKVKWDSNNAESSEIEIHKSSEEERGSLSESEGSEWQSDLSLLGQVAEGRKTRLLISTIIRWTGCGVLLTSSFLRFSVLSLPYFLLFLLSFLHITKNYFIYYVPQRRSILVLGALSAYSFSCVIFEIVIAALLGSGKYVPTTSALRSLESIGVADFKKSTSAGLRGLLPDIFVFIFSGVSLGVTWYLWKRPNLLPSTTLAEQRRSQNISLNASGVVEEQSSNELGDYISRVASSRMTIYIFYSCLLLVSITFASVATCIAMLFVDVVLLAWAIGPVTFSRWRNRLLEDEKLKGASYYERRLLSQVPPSLPDRILDKILPFSLKVSNFLIFFLNSHRLR